MVSLILVSRKRPLLLSRLLQSLETEMPVLPFEIIIALNGEQRKDHPPDSPLHSFSATILELPEITSAAARNLAIQKSRGEWLLFLDDDVTLPPGYFQKARKLMAAFPYADIVGGPDQTPHASTHLQRTIGCALSSFFCTGKTYFRHSRTTKIINHASESELILCGLWLRKKSIHHLKEPFPADFERNEENVLLYQLKQKKSQMIHDPELYVFHERRNQLKGLAGQALRSGRCRIRSFVRDPSSLELAYFVPLLFAVSLIGLGLHSLLTGSLLPLVSLALLYATSCVAFAAVSCIKQREPFLIPGTALLHFWIHAAYAAGSFQSICSLSSLRVSLRALARPFEGLKT